MDKKEKKELKEREKERKKKFTIIFCLIKKKIVKVNK